MTSGMLSAPKSFLRQPEWLLAAGITLAVVGLNIFFLFHAGGFCGDEVDVINLASRTTLSDMARDSFPVLMPLVVKGWSAMGLAKTDLSLRILGILIGLGMAGALWLPAWTARRTPPLLSLTLLGLNGTAIFWAGYLRAYGLGSLLIIITLAAMCCLLKKPTWRRTGILSVAAILSVQALYQNAVFFASIGLGGWLVCWLRKDGKTALKILTAALAAVISLLPYLECVLKWQQSAATIRPGFSLQAAADNFNTIAAFPLAEYVWIWKLLGLAVIGLGMAVFFRPPKRIIPSGDGLTSAELQVFAGGTALSAVAGYLGFLYLAGLITSPWYFLPLLAVAAACFDLGLPWTGLPRLWRTVIFGVLLATAGIAVPFAARDLNCRFTNVDQLVARLQPEISPQDFLVVTPWYLGISFDRYYKGAAAWSTLPPVADHATYRFDLLPSAHEMSSACQPVLDRIAGTLQAGHRVWVAGWMSVPAPGRKAATEAGQFIAEHSLSFEPVPLPIQGNVSDYENESLLRASGWKPLAAPNAPTNSP